jgi:hypothetical protein
MASCFRSGVHLSFPVALGSADTTSPFEIVAEAGSVGLRIGEEHHLQYYFSIKAVMGW